MDNQAIYEKNKNFLMQHNPIFLERILQSQPEDFSLKPAKKRGFFVEKEGKTLNSRIDPITEAEKSVEKDDFSESELIILGGINLGYTLSYLFSRYPEKKILVVEKSLFLLFLAFQVTDFTPMLSSGRVEIMVPENLIAVQDFLKEFRLKKFALVFHRASFELYPEFYQELKEIVTRFFTTREVNTATLARFEKLWFKNMLQNMPFFLRYPGIQILFEKLTNKPVLIVGAGPSLSRQIAILKEYQTSFTLIAVNTSLPYLIENGIFPDIAVVVDPQDKVFRYFFPLLQKKLPRYPILVAEPTISPKIARHYPGVVLFCSPGFLENWISLFSEPKGDLEMGGSVITAAYSLACKMGANPIVFLGTDMSYTEKTLHFRGAELEKEWLYTQTKKESQEHKQWHFIRKFELFPHEGFYGQPVYTDMRFLTYIHWLEKKFAQEKNRTIINATEGGIAFRHILQKTLLETLTEYQQEKPPIPEIHPVTDYSERKRLFIESLSSLEEKFPPLLSEAKKALSIAKKIYHTIEKNKNPDPKALEELDKIDKNIETFKTSDILSISIQKVLHQVSEEMDMHLTEKEKNNSGLKIMRYSIALYEAIIESVLFTQTQIKKVKKIVGKNI